MSFTCQDLRLFLVNPTIHELYITLSPSEFALHPMRLQQVVNIVIYLPHALHRTNSYGRRHPTPGSPWLECRRGSRTSIGRSLPFLENGHHPLAPRTIFFERLLRKGIRINGLASIYGTWRKCDRLLDRMMIVCSTLLFRRPHVRHVALGFRSHDSFVGS